MKLKLAFFDIDGTLIRRNKSDSITLKSASFNYALNTVLGLNGINYLTILGKRIFGLTDKAVLKRTILELGYDESVYYQNETALFSTLDEYFERYKDDPQYAEYVVIPGIPGFLDSLRGNSIRLGLVTGNIRKHSDWKMRGVGFESYFTTGAFGDDGENRWDILSVALTRNNDIPPSDVCHFGDSPLDLESARRLGIRGVAISDLGGGTHSRRELNTVEYGLIVDSWHETDKIEDYLSKS